MPKSAKSCLRSVAAATSGFLLAVSSQAAVLYDEAVSGDLQGNQATPVLVGSFLDGVNTAVGQMSRPTNVGGQGDTFAVTLLSGQNLQSLTLTISNSTNDESAAATLFVAPLGGQSFLALRQVYPVKSDGVYTFTLPSSVSTPQAADTILGLSLQFATSLNAQASMDWSWEATVATPAPVPEPSAAFLMLGGLGLVGVLARRRRQG